MTLSVPCDCQGKNLAKYLEISAYSGKIICQVLAHKSEWITWEKGKVMFQFYEATAAVAEKEKNQYHKTPFYF